MHGFGIALRRDCVKRRDQPRQDVTDIGGWKCGILCVRMQDGAELTPTVVVKECSSTVFFTSIPTENDPELRLSADGAMDYATHLKSLFSAPTYSTKSASSTSSRTEFRLLAPA